jgi:hypothetical protein
MTDRIAMASEGLSPQNGEDVTVPTGTSATITTTTTYRPALQGIIVQALSTNTATIFVGVSGVTVSTGIELQAGDRVTLPITDPRKIFSISGTASQKLRFMVV